MGYLQQRDDNTCYVWITGNRIGHWVPIQEAIPIEDLERQNRVLNNVLASAIRSPVPPSDPALAEQGIYNIFVYLSRVHPPGYLEEMERMLGGTLDANNSQRTCELMYEFFVAMSRIRSAERAAVWKSVFANSISQ